MAARRRLRIAEFTHDFAADAANRKAETWWDERINSLSRASGAWADACRGGWGWLNPPFKDISPWAEKCKLTRAAGGQVAFLVPAGVGANWFRDHVDGHALVLFLNGRLCFIKNWQTTIDPATLREGNGPPRFYASEPLYPKDCILCLYSQLVTPGYEVWTWREQLS